MERLSRTRYDSQSQKSYFNFKCKCGNIVEKRSDSKSEYCSKPGCKFSIRKMHGKGQKTNHLYRRWEAILARCYRKQKCNSTYFGKIIVCELWKNNYLEFEKWAMSTGYERHLTIDRININGNYEPSNCEWITRAENTRRQIEDGHTIKTKTSKYHGVNFNTKAQKYQSTISINNKKKTKIFNNEHDAAEWYNSMAKEYKLRRPINIIKDYQHDT